MLRILTIVLAVLAGIHGLIHLMGFAAYWPLAKINELPYKTSLLAGRLEVGTAGMRVFSLLWLLATLGFVIAAIALVLGKSNWAPLMLGAALLSIVLCALDWSAAFRGALIDVFFLLVLALVFGLRMQSAPFPTYTGLPAPVTTVPIPAGLPEPVERFYRMHHGDEVPEYHSVVVSMRGTLRFMGITLPARLRFSHIAGQDYRHYIEATFYGYPVMKVNEHYLGGHSRLELPFRVVENDPKVDSAANQGLWAETFAFFPAVVLTDGRVSWESVDENTAKVYVPFGESEQVFTVQFDPQTGYLRGMETLRYRDQKVGTIRWRTEVIRGENSNEPFQISATWEDEAIPWMVVEVEEAVFNTDLTDYIRQTGP